MSLKEQAEAFLTKEGGSPNMLRHKPEAIWLMEHFADDAVTDYKARLLAKMEELKAQYPQNGDHFDKHFIIQEVRKIVEEL